jgi:hypothetical protein
MPVDTRRTDAPVSCAVPSHSSAPVSRLWQRLLASLRWRFRTGDVDVPRHRVLFESLEPRLLLSATPTLLGTMLDDNDLSGNPAIYGTIGNDIIDALAGDDVVYGDAGGGSGAGGGNDIVVGGDGRDLLYGEDGDDWIEPGPMPQPVLANQTVYGGDGTDTLFLRGAPTDYQFFDYTNGGFIANAIVAAAPEGQVAAFEIEYVSFGVSVLDYADGTARPLALVAVAQILPGAGDRAPIAVGDSVTGGRGATEVLIGLPALFANDTDLDGDAFALAELLGAPGVTVEGFDNDPLTVLPDVPPEYAADFPDGLVRVRLDAPLTGPVTFEYRLADASTGTLTGNTATVTLRPSAPPTAADDTLRATIGQDTFFSYDRLLANDSSGLTFLRIVPESVVASGNVRVDDEGSGLRVASFDTSPGTLSFTYEAQDAFGNVASANVSVEVVNRAPIVADGAAVVTPGGIYTLRFDDLVAFPANFDPDGDALSIASYGLTLPSTVTLMGFADRIEFSFAADYAGDYALDFALADATGAEDAGRFRFLTTTPAAPVAVADTLRWGISTGPGQAFGTFSLSRLLANDAIAPGVRVYADFTTVAQPANGIFYFGPGNPNSVVPTTDPLNLMLSYMPRPGFTGTDTVTYDIVDELGRRSTSTLTFDVSVPAPVVPDTTIAIPAGATSVTFPVSALLESATVVGPVKFSGHAIRFDGNSGVLEAQVDPITGRYVSFTYTPDADTILGEDAFFVGLVDEGAEGGSARGATFVRFATETHADLSLTLDIAADALRAGESTDVVVRVDNAGPASARGVVRLTPGLGVRFLGASEGFDPVSGIWTFGQIAAGGFAEIAIDTVFATVGTLDVVGEIMRASATDSDSTPGNGIVVGEDDSAVDSVTVRAANRPPVARDFVASETEDFAAFEINLAGLTVDPDGNATTWTINRIVGGAVIGFDPTSGRGTFVPTANFNGVARIEWMATDGEGLFDTASIAINILAVNDAPVAVADTPITIRPGQTATFTGASLLANDTDADGDALSITQIFAATAQGGSVVSTGFDTFVYTPPADFLGIDTFRYGVSDGFGGTVEATLAIVVARSGAPVVRDDSYRVLAGGVLDIAAPGLLANDTDPDGDGLSVTLANVSGLRGSLVPYADGRFRFTAQAGFLGDTSFTYTATDGRGGYDQGTVTITVYNSVPMAGDDTYVARPGRTLDIAAPGLLANDSDGDGDALAITVANVSGLRGSLVPYADGRFRFTPEAGFLGATSFTYTATDGRGGYDTATVTIDVANSGPSANDDEYTVHVGTVLDIVAPGLLANDTDADGDALAITIANVSGLQGTLVPYADGRFRFTPTAGFTGDTSFRYTVSDGFGGYDTATVTVHVTNAAPVATDDTYTVRANRTLDIPVPGLLGNDTDADGDALNVTLANVTGLQGTVVPYADGRFRFTPTAGFTGQTSFTYTIGDGHGGFDTGTVTIDVVNRPPVVGNDTYSIHAGDVLDVSVPGLLGNDTDADGDALSITVANVTGLRGSLVPFADGHFRFSPETGFSGTTGFTYTVTDGYGAFVTGTVSIDVTNTSPTVVGESYVVRSGQVLTVTAPGLLGNDVDADGDALTIARVDTARLAGKGSVTFTPEGRFTFTPLAGFSGVADFGYTVTDGNGAFVDALVSIEVIAANANRAPVAGDDEYSVHAGQSLVVPVPGILGNDSDPDGDALRVAVVNITDLRGTLTPFVDGQFTFTASPGFVGDTSFTYSVSDGLGGFDTATVTLHVTNAAPQAVDNHYSMRANTSLSIPATTGLLGNDTDADGDPLRVSVVNITDLQGTLTPYIDGRFNFTPVAGFTGTTSFSYTVTDGLGGFDTATVTIDVVNRAPIAVDDVYSVHSGQVLSIPTPGLLGNDTDADSDPLSISVVNITDLQGTLTPYVNGRFTFTPSAGFIGTTSFTYTVRDGFGGFDTGTVTIHVTNAAPVATDDHYVVRRTQTLTIPVGTGLLGNDTDADGDPLRVAVVNISDLQGTLTPYIDGRFNFTPAAGFTGTTGFSYTISDGLGGFDTATVTIDVVNSAPLAGDDVYTVHTGQTLAIATPGLLANDTDADADPLRVSVVNVTNLQGTLTPYIDGRFNFSPSAGFTGTTSFSYTVADGFGGFDTATVTIHVANAAPVARDDQYTMRANGTLAVPLPGLLGNDSDADGDALRVSVVNVSGLRGTLTPYLDGRFTFTPAAGFVGTTGFAYTISDGHGGFDTADVRITVRPEALTIRDFVEIPGGFHVSLSRPVDVSRFALHDPAGGGPDVRLVGERTGAVRGSVVFDADGLGMNFVKTGGPLAADKYTLELRAGGFAALDGELLDGDRDGEGGDDYVFEFTVAPAPGAVVATIADFMRGPGQDVVVPNSGRSAAGLPIRLSNGAGIQRFAADLFFDSSLLGVDEVLLPAGLTGRITTTLIDGGLRVEVVLDAPLRSGAVDIVDLVARVPESASYGAQQILELRNVRVEAGSGRVVESRGDSAVHTVGYFGDANGDRTYSRADVAALQNVIIGRDAGFGAWRNTDPVIVGDINGSGALTSLDAARLLQRVVAGSRPEIPPIPAPVATPAALPPAPMMAALPPAPMMAALPPAPPTLAAPAGPVLAAAGSPGVDWNARLPDAALPLPPAPPSATSPSTDGAWKATHWAKDLGARLRQVGVETGGGSSSKTLLGQAVSRNVRR